MGLKATPLNDGLWIRWASIARAGDKQDLTSSGEDNKFINKISLMLF